MAVPIKISSVITTEQVSLVSMTQREKCGWRCIGDQIANPAYIFTDEYKQCQARCDRAEVRGSTPEMMTNMQMLAPPSNLYNMCYTKCGKDQVPFFNKGGYNLPIYFACLDGCKADEARRQGSGLPPL